MDWRVARSLNTLLEQLNEMFPHRSKVSDGSIGDAAHATRDSDHNPWYGPGIVTARDFTHDPAGGLNCHWLAAQLVASRDRRIKYIIWDSRILSGAGGPSPWAWRQYSGTNPHTKHLHLSVVASALCDDTAAWKLGVTEEDDMTPDELLDYQIPRVGSALGGNTSLRAVLSNWDRALELDAGRDRALTAAVVALSDDPALDKAAVAEIVDAAVKAHTPTADQIAAATRPLLEEAVRDVVPDEQAALIIQRLADKLATPTGGN